MLTHIGSRIDTIDRLRREARRRRRIGILVLILVFAGVPLAIIRPNPFNRPLVVKAVFDEAVGVSLVQRDVRVGGVRVGRIGDVRRVGDDAEIELLIDEDVGEIHADARAALRPHHPFEGTAFIDLDPGSDSAPELGDRPIPKSQTTTYVSLDQALRAFDRPTRDALAGIVAELAPALGRGAPGIQRMLRNAPPLMHDAALANRAAQGPSGDELRTLIPALSKTVDALAGRGDRLATAVAGADRTLAGLTVDAARPLDATLAQLPATLRDAQRTAAAAQRVTASARAAAPPLIAAMQEIGPTARASVPLLRHAQPALRALAPVLRNLEGALTNLGRSDPTATRVLKALKPPAEVLRRSTLPYLTADSALGQPTYMQLISGLTALTGAMQHFQPEGRNPYGDGHVLRASFDILSGLQGLPSTLPIPCSTLQQLNPEFAKLAENNGLCTK